MVHDVFPVISDLVRAQLILGVGQGYSAYCEGKMLQNFLRFNCFSFALLFAD
jgi:hypothetical protein